MSKRMTRVLSLILTLVMFVSVSTPAFAWGGGDMGGGWDREIGEGDFRDFNPAEEVEEEEEEFDYFQTDGAEGFQVTVEAPMGSLPTLAELRAEAVEVEDVREAVESVVEGKANILVAMDISFWMNGVEIEPEEPVRVKISAPELDGKNNLTVIHIPDAEEPETVELLDESELSFALGTNEVAFRADSFSVYAVVGEEGDPESRLTVNFYGVDQGEEAEPVATVYVKNGDVLLGDGTPVDSNSYIEDIMYDPSLGALGDDKVFVGWSIDAANANTDEAYDTEHYGASYSTTTKPYKADEICSYLAGLTDANSITEGDELNIYAMIFNQFTVTYQMKVSHVVLASFEVLYPLDGDSASYTITENYTAVTDTQHFDGWHLEEGTIENAKLDNAAVNDPYPQGTTMTLKSSVVFSAEISDGYWMVFEENAYGATYNAPVFVKTEQTPGQVRPDLSQKTNMKCTGYEFDNWYVLKPGVSISDLTPVNGYYVIDDEHFEVFNGWNQSLGDRLVLYAKWTVADTTKYTVIVWTQSVTDVKDLADDAKTYDYAFSAEVTDIASLTPVADLDLSDYNSLEGQTVITGDGEDDKVDFTGFRFRTAVAKGTVKNAESVDAVNPNGTTIVDVYYDRVLVTYNFYIGGEGPTYAQYTGKGQEGDYYLPDGNGGYTLTHLYWDGDYWYKRYTSGLFGGYSDQYRGKIYVKTSDGTPVTLQETMTGLYGQRLEDCGYTWSMDYRWYTSLNGGDFISFKDVFEKSVNPNPSDLYVTDFYGKVVTFDSNIKHYLQLPDGTYPTEANYTVKTIVPNGMRFRTFQGYKPDEFRIKLPDGIDTYQTGQSYSGNSLVNPTTHDAIDGWTDWLPAGTGVEYTNNKRHEIGVYNATKGGIEFRYALRTYELVYMPGRFVDKDQVALTPKLTASLKEVSGIAFAESLAPYAEGGAQYYNPDTSTVSGENYLFDDFVFMGWFIDETCTTKALFDGSMPAGNMTVYGKWQQKEYRVFLKPNVPQGDDLEWGSASQQMNFKVSHNEKISVPTGRRTGYEFLGWYTDEGLNNAYAVDTKLNDQTVPATPFYDKTVYMTEGKDEHGEEVQMDKYGMFPEEAVSLFNKDASRPWVQRMLILYAKWSQILDGGAEGIGVLYDANGGDPAPTDGNLYKDNVNAIAKPAPATAPPDRVDENGDSHKQVFLYWVMQKWDDSANEGAGGYVDLGNDDTYHKYPGETFSVLKDNAHEEDLPDGDGTPDNPSKSYTIQLRAEWGDADVPTPTHINWYSNLRDEDGGAMALDSFTHSSSTSNVENKGWVVKDEGKQINEAIDIRPATTYSYPGYHFLGWAKKANATAEELFLKWEDDHYEAKDSDGKWVTVTKVAADEKKPYDDLYAIWEAGSFYIYHTSNKTVEKISAANLVNGKYDLAAKVASGTLYGGYYTEYGGVGAGFDPTKLTGDGPFVDANGTAYSLDQVANSATLWNLEKVCTENGHAMTPKADTVYYLKEVPDAYLKPYTQYTYYELKEKENMLGTVWCILGTDDLNYQSAGFTLTKDEDNGQKSDVKSAEMGASLKFWPESNPGLAQTLTYEIYAKYQVKAGFLGYAELNDFAADANGVFSGTVVIRQFWVTKDGVTVYGTTQRALSFGDGKRTSLSASDTTPTEP